MHSRRVIAKSQGQDENLLVNSRETIRNNPFLALTLRIPSRLPLACPSVRSALVSPTSGESGFERFKVQHRLQTTGKIKLKPIRIIRAPRMEAVHLPKVKGVPYSPRPVRTPSFSDEPLSLPSIKCRQTADKRRTFTTKRPTSLKKVVRPEVACSFGVNIM